MEGASSIGIESSTASTVLPDTAIEMDTNNDEDSVPSLNVLPNENPHGSIVGVAMDVILVTPPHIDLESPGIRQGGDSTRTSPNDVRDGPIVACSDFIVSFPSSHRRKLTSMFSFPSSSSSSSTDSSKTTPSIVVQINGRTVPSLSMSWSNGERGGNDTKEGMATASPSSSRNGKFRNGNSSKPSTAALNRLVQSGILHSGRNLLRYYLVVPKKKRKDESTPGGEEYKVLGTTEASLFCWSCHDVVIVSDIDGTVTQSDVRGVLDTIVTERFEYVHRGVCRLFSHLSQQPFVSCASSNKDKRISKMHFLYLSSRPLSLINSTRKFITTLTQSSPPISSSDNDMIVDGKDSHTHLNDLKPQLTKREDFKLPPGPIFCHTGSVVDVLKAELIDKTAHLFKSDVLRRQVIIPFVAAGKQPNSKLFFAGFGNKKTDAMAYSMVGLERQDIFIINTASTIICMNSTEAVEDGKNSKLGLKKVEKKAFRRQSSDLTESVIHTVPERRGSDLSNKSIFDRLNDDSDDRKSKNQFHADDQSFYGGPVLEDSCVGLCCGDLSILEGTSPVSSPTSSLHSSKPVSLTRKSSLRRFIGTKFHGYDDPRLEAVLWENLSH